MSIGDAEWLMLIDVLKRSFDMMDAITVQDCMQYKKRSCERGQLRVTLQMVSCITVVVNGDDVSEDEIQATVGLSRETRDDEDNRSTVDPLEFEGRFREANKQWRNSNPLYPQVSRHASSSWAMSAP